jgi:stage V sporulation protein D (sporulation-specific penicillin-binding protein)
MNSCNPVFIGLGQKIGVHKYYEYLEKFGFLRKTGIDIYGEAGSIFLSEEKVGPVELATISFGQRFEVTPIQMITMVSTIANKGKYVYPRLVQGLVDTSTGEVEEIEPKYGEQVISEETAETVLSMMTSVVSTGTGKNAKVEGYLVGGKTGTSEDGVNTGKYVTSFIGVANTDDPEVAILVTLYNPTGEGGHQGGGVAAPVAGQILSEVLPYLELKKSEEEEAQKFVVPDVVGLSLKEAKKALESFEIEIESENYTDDSIVSKQIPESGLEVSGKVIIYVD